MIFMDMGRDVVRRAGAANCESGGGMTNLAANFHPRSSDDASSSLFPHARPAVHRNASQQPRTITTKHVIEIPPYRRSTRLYIDENDYMNYECAGGR